MKYKIGDRVRFIKARHCDWLIGVEGTVCDMPINAWIGAAVEMYWAEISPNLDTSGNSAWNIYADNGNQIVNFYEHEVVPVDRQMVFDFMKEP